MSPPILQCFSEEGTNFTSDAERTKKSIYQSMLKQISEGGTKRRFMPKRTDLVQNRDLYQDNTDHNKNQSLPNATDCFNLLDNHHQKVTNNNTTEDLIDSENFQNDMKTEEANFENIRTKYATS